MTAAPAAAATPAPAPLPASKGKGLDGVIRKAPGYLNPATDLLEEGATR